MRLIDADELLKKIKEISHYDDYDVLVVDWDDMIICIDTAPTIDAELVRHGKWIFKEHFVTTDMSIGYFVCSECGCVLGNVIGNHYCFHCGAKMEPKE